MATKKVGIIVPIYNVENYLKKCLDSLINQTYQDLMIVLINDGSIDSSLQIAKTYALKDKRFILIDKPNGGLSSARNTGIDFLKQKFILEKQEENLFKIQGDNPYQIRSIFYAPPPCGDLKVDYLLFLDSDDFLVLDCIEKYVFQMQKYQLDFVTSGIQRFNANYQWISSDFSLLEGFEKNKIYRGYEILEKIPKNYFHAVWNILIDFDFLKKHHFSFIPNIIYEDHCFGTELFCKANKVMILNENFYCCVLSLNSITRSTNLSQERKILEFNSWLKTIINLEQIAQKNDVTLIQSQIRKFYLPMLYSCLLEIEDKEKYYAELEKFKQYELFSLKIFLIRYFPKLFIFLRKIKCLLKK